MPSKSGYDFKKLALVQALKKSRGNRTHAAADLGVSVRTVRTWVKRYSLARRFPARRGRKN